MKKAQLYAGFIILAGLSWTASNLEMVEAASIKLY